MKILHVAPHLGGGVGKAHAALQSALPYEVERTFVLLEQPRDRRYVAAIEAGGARVTVARDLDEVAGLARTADIVQFEFWNHPRLFECLARCAFPPMRSIFWSHISGFAPPLIPSALVASAMRFVFTSAASLDLAAAFPPEVRERLAVVHSGFGFAHPPRPAPSDRKTKIAYLGTVDDAKMHPGFFDVIDGLMGEFHVSVWGAVDPDGPVAARHRAMRNPARVTLQGQTADPQSALTRASIFFYPLRRNHYGTGENALVEAMSLGLVPVVLNNAPELAIVRDGETGFVARSIAECALLLQMLLDSPDVRERISRNAAVWAAEYRQPEQSAREFMILWLGLLNREPCVCDFASVLGDTPADWFLATQGLPRAGHSPATKQDGQRDSKGTLAHFESVFAHDTSLARLRASR